MFTALFRLMGELEALAECLIGFSLASCAKRQSNISRRSSDGKHHRLYFKVPKKGSSYGKSAWKKDEKLMLKI